MTVIMTAPARLALMMYDCHPSIRGTYYTHQDSIDQIVRPAFLITVEDASFPQFSSEQEQVEENYQIAYIGETFGAGQANEYELRAREVSEAACLYLLQRPNLQFGNLRARTDITTQRGLAGVLSHTFSRSAITLFERDGVDVAFWGFTIDITLKTMMDYEIQW